MTFFFGLLCGIVIGVVVTHLTHTYLDAMLPLREDEEPRSCPPCDHLCNQGRDCPAGEKK
jgi:hypothetical protein